VWRAIKKNNGSQNEFSSGPRNEELVAHYEQLRKDALSPAARSPAPGLALFLQKGMIAWMRAWSTCTPNTVAEVISPAVAIPSSPQDIRAQLAVLLAGLILSQQVEVTT